MAVRLDRRRTVERLERRIGRESAVAELARTALAGAPLSVLLGRAALLVVQELPAAGCQVLEISADGGLRRSAVAGTAARSAATETAAETATRLAAATLRSAGPVTFSEPPTEALDPTAAAVLSVRIEGHGQQYGVLAAYAGRQRGFAADQLDFVAAVASVLSSAISRRQAADADRRRALHDPLTGLPNRTLLLDRLEQAVALARRAASSVAVLLADVDGFDAVSEALGHAAGDAVLIGVAERLRAGLRASDTLARLEGAEFGVALPGLATVEEATEAATRLHSSLERPLRLGEVLVPLAAHVGVAVFPEHGVDATAVLQRADVALQRARARRTPVATYRPTTDARHSRRLSLAGDLSLAIDNDALELDYQPLVDLTSGAVGSVEALVRWRDATGEVLSAHDLVLLAEHSGLIRPLSAWVLDRAVRQLAEWEGLGTELRVAVNVSGGALEDDGFRDQLTRSLAVAELSPARLSLEITESVILSEHARAALTGLAETGIAISIDDFGTGYASLSYLKHLPVSQLKVDRSFVTRVAEDPRDLAIVRSVVELAHALGLQVVVEGVEDAAAAALLRDLSADLAQGYLFSRPLTPSRLTAWLAARPEPRGWPVRQLTLPDDGIAAGAGRRG